MKSRERVLKAIKKQEGLPDCVPVQFDLCKQMGIEGISYLYANDEDLYD